VQIALACVFIACHVPHVPGVASEKFTLVVLEMRLVQLTLLLLLLLLGLSVEVGREEDVDRFLQELRDSVVVLHHLHQLYHHELDLGTGH